MKKALRKSHGIYGLNFRKLFMVVSMMMVMSLLTITQTFAQESMSVSGNITDDTNFPLPGVAVIIKGTTTGTITDIDGNFNLNTTKGATLVFSFIGMVTQEVFVTSPAINISMVSDAMGLDEVVVVGYGSQKKQTLTGSIEQVKAEVFERSAVANPVLSLQGQTPGLTIARTSSRASDDGDIDITIRGTNSINGETPLIIIDGVATLGQSAFTSLNADDIETMSILKDGSAAIYGARASNGVILITTKKGSGDIKVSVSSQMKVNTVSMRPPVAQNAAEYARLWYSYGVQDKAAGVDASYWVWTESELDWMMNEVPGYMEDTDIWGDMYVGNNSKFDDFYGTSYSQQHNVSVSGGSEKSNFRVSLGYVEDMGPVIPVYDGKKQYNLRSNYNFDVTKWLTIETSTSYFNRKYDEAEYDGTRALSEVPLFPKKNPFGNWGANFGQAGGGINRLAELVDGGRSTQTREELRTKLSAIITLAPQLTFRADAAIDRAWTRKQEYQLEVETYAWNDELATAQINDGKNYIEETANDDRHETYQGIFNYSKKISDHSFSVMGGGTAEKRTSDKLSAKQYDFIDLGVYDLDMGSSDNAFEITGGGSNWGLMSLLGRFNYTYKDKYLLEFQGRRDGSSKFAEGYKWSNFGGGSLGWIITEESFLKDNSILSFLKLRASYGQLGNQGGIENHEYVSLVDRSETVVFGESGTEYGTATASDITTNEKTWEKVKTTNIGVDMRLFQGKLSGTFDYYHMLNDGMLSPITFPSVLGGDAPATNSATLETNGWEVQLGWSDKIGDLRYNVGFNISDSRNELTNKEGATAKSEGLNDGTDVVEGYALDTYFMYKTDGFFATQEDADAYYTLNTSTGDSGNLPASPATLRAGDTNVVDVNGDNVINTSDLVDCGDAAVHYSYGINLGLEWHNWDFSTFFQGVLEHNIYRGDGQMSYPRSSHYTNQTTAYDGQTWTPENTGAKYPRVSGWADIAEWNYSYKDLMVADGNYLRCKTLSLGYTFKNIQLRDSKIDKLRVFFTGNDLFTFTSMDNNWDPEYGDSSDTTYPFYKTWSFGLNLTF